MPPVVAEAPDGGDETAVRGMATTAVPSAASQRVADAVVHLRNCMQSAGHAGTRPDIAAFCAKLQELCTLPDVVHDEQYA